MSKSELYMKLDTLKLALDTSAALLAQSRFIPSPDGANIGATISPENVRSINTTISTAERMLRHIMTEELNTIKGDDQEEDD